MILYKKENSLLIGIDPLIENSILLDEFLEQLNQSKFEKESLIKGNGKYLKLSEIQKLYNKGEKKICKINNKICGTGFFLEIEENVGIPIKKALFTCNHVINKNHLISKKDIDLKYQKENKYLEIKNSVLYTLENYEINDKNSDKKRKLFTDKFLDYTCIEILDNDFDNNIELFEINKDELKENDNIFILHHPCGEDDLSYSLGQIKKIENSTIFHSASTISGSSGSPILNREDLSVIGIHFGGTKYINMARNMKMILEDIKRKISDITKIKILSNILKIKI